MPFNDYKAYNDTKPNSLPRQGILSPTANNRTQVTEESSAKVVLSPTDSCNLRHKKPEMSGHNSSIAASLPPQTLPIYEKRQTNLNAVAETRIIENRPMEDKISPASRSVPGFHE